MLAHTVIRQDEKQCVYRAGHIDGGGCYETVKKLLREGETWQEPLADS